MSDRKILFLFDKDRPRDETHPLQRFSERMEFIAEQLHLAEEDLALTKDHISARLDPQIEAFWDTLDALQKEVILTGYELGLVAFHAPEPPSTT